MISLITATKSISKKTSKILAKCLVKFIFVVLVFINSKSRDDFVFINSKSRDDFVFINSKSRDDFVFINSKSRDDFVFINSKSRDDFVFINSKSRDDFVLINSKSRDDSVFQFFVLFVPPTVLSYLIFAQVSHSSLSKKHCCTNV